MAINFTAELRQRELEKERQMRDAEMRMREREEMRRKEEEMYRMRQDDLAQQMQRREDELRRRVQENSMFLQVRSKALPLETINQLYADDEKNYRLRSTMKQIFNGCNVINLIRKWSYPNFISNEMENVYCRRQLSFFGWQEEAMRAGGSDSKEGMQSAQTNDTYSSQGGYGTNGRWDRSATGEGQYPAFVTSMDPISYLFELLRYHAIG